MTTTVTDTGAPEAPNDTPALLDALESFKVRDFVLIAGI